MNFLIKTFTFICFINFYLMAQVETRKPAELDIPNIYFDLLGFAPDSGSGSRLDVYIQIPYENIFFLKEGPTFTASYELTISLLDSNKKLIKEKLWNETVKTEFYEETISPKHYKISQQSFLLPSGKYFIRVQIRDNQTKKSISATKSIELRNYNDSKFSASDMMILNKLTYEGEKKIISPNISGNVVDLPGGFYVFLEVYNYLSADTLQLDYEIFKDQRKVIRSGTSIHPLQTTKNAIFFKVNSNELPIGEYILNVILSPKNFSNSTDENFRFKYSLAKPFSIHWRGMPTSIVDLDAAIDQMIYIEDAAELKRIKSLPLNEKVAAFKELWKKKDPTPNTERNELMEEYYSRVEYANKNFKHYIDGWKTDMGMVFIIFGSPNNVDRHPFDIDSKPYEVWYYYQLNRQFVFVDESGFGDYKLVTPIWDIWQRTR